MNYLNQPTNRERNQFMQKAFLVSNYEELVKVTLYKHLEDRKSAIIKEEFEVLKRMITGEYQFDKMEYMEKNNSKPV